MNDFVAKPMDIDEFYGTLLRWLQAPPADAAPPARVRGRPVPVAARRPGRGPGAGRLAALPGLNVERGLEALLSQAGNSSRRSGVSGGADWARHRRSLRPRRRREHARRSALDPWRRGLAGARASAGWPTGWRIGYALQAAPTTSDPEPGAGGHPGRPAGALQARRCGRLTPWRPPSAPAAARP